jgi:glycosyltransferase involved in cell wall biosynthesis
MIIEKLSYKCLLVSSNSHLASDGLLYSRNIIASSQQISTLRGKVQFIRKVFNAVRDREQKSRIVLIDLGNSLYWIFLAYVVSINSQRVLIIHNTIEQDSSQQHSILRRMIRTFLIRRASHVVVFSKFVKSELRVHTNANIQVVPLLPEISITSPMKFHRGTFVISMIGRWSSYKGLEFGLEVYEKLRIELGDKIELHLHGSGFNRDFSEFNIPGIRFFSKEPYNWNELLINLESTSLVLLPYRYASQSGVQVLANHLHIPTLVSPVGGLPEYQDPNLPPVELEENLWVLQTINVMNNLDYYVESCKVHVSRTYQDHSILNSWSRALNYDN